MRWITHHVVGDDGKGKNGNDAVGDEVSEDLGQEVDGRAVVAAGVFVAAQQKWPQQNDPINLKSDVWKGVSHEDGPLVDEELHGREIPKHHVDDEEEEGAGPTQRGFVS